MDRGFRLVANDTDWQKMVRKCQICMNGTMFTNILHINVKPPVMGI